MATRTSSSGVSDSRAQKAASAASPNTRSAHACFAVAPIVTGPRASIRPARCRRAGPRVLAAPSSGRSRLRERRRPPGRGEREVPSPLDSTAAGVRDSLLRTATSLSASRPCPRGERPARRQRDQQAGPARATPTTQSALSRPASTSRAPARAPPPIPIWNATTYSAEAVSADRGATRSTAACPVTGRAVKAAPQRITAVTVAAADRAVSRPARATATPTAHAAAARRGRESVTRPASQMPAIPAAPYPKSTADRARPVRPASRRISSVM